jgi:hypothetical protein
VIHIYVKIVLYCSVFFHIALVEFAFGVVERGMTGSEPSLGDVVMLGFFLLYVNRSGDTALKRPIDSPPNKGCSTVGHWKQHLGFVCGSPSL